MSNYIDPLDAATQAGNRPDAYYGRMDVSAAFVKLTKGVGKGPWSENDPVDQRRTEVHLILNPLDVSGLNFLIERRLLAESSEWSKIVWASLRTCGVKAVRDLNGKYVRAEMVKTGRSYPSKRTGEMQEETTFSFSAVYNTEAEAVAAYYAELGDAPADVDPAMAVDMGPLPTPATAHTNGNGSAPNPERETAQQFLNVLVKQANGDVNALAAALANMPMVSKYFTITSPEVLQAMGVTA